MLCQTHQKTASQVFPHAIKSFQTFPHKDPYPPNPLSILSKDTTKSIYNATITAPTSANIDPPNFNFIAPPETTVLVELAEASVADDEVDVVFVANVVLELFVEADVADVEEAEVMVEVIEETDVDALVEAADEDEEEEDKDDVVAVEDCVLAEAVTEELMVNSAE